MPNVDVAAIALTATATSAAVQAIACRNLLHAEVVASRAAFFLPATFQMHRSGDRSRVLVAYGRRIFLAGSFP
jgi:hypothetical protein